MTDPIVIHHTIKRDSIEEESARPGDFYTELEQLPARLLNYDTYHLGERAFIAHVSGDAGPERLRHYRQSGSTAASSTAALER